ncbi:hypothetical protein JW859_00060 [bacterium]|nr:hypothetical protein [bacterium]
MRFAALCCVLWLLVTAPVWACDDCCKPCDHAQPCRQDCETACTDVFCCCEPVVCEPPCPFGWDGIFSGFTEIPMLDDGFQTLDLSCCPPAEYCKLPCAEWCVDYHLCCPRAEYELLCPKCECEVCPPVKKCHQDTCTPAPGCECGCG